MLSGGQRKYKQKNDHSEGACHHRAGARARVCVPCASSRRHNFIFVCDARAAGSLAFVQIVLSAISITHRVFGGESNREILLRGTRRDDVSYIIIIIDVIDFRNSRNLSPSGFRVPFVRCHNPPCSYTGYDRRNDIALSRWSNG